MAPDAATQLPDLWDDAHAASVDEPGLLLYRSNRLGPDPRVRKLSSFTLDLNARADVSFTR